ncbi:hypothetical protein RI844_10180 [Thalassotalea fonticola]|uniref:Uncharacterized protein n=1 Tax=Thalassotalea fonticola TaxID=3065649 RepID=A0ABZ0GJP1_9GAMM|nr:hypothetical protein RI844_10180 [Colwelliaceae bacterium S1-1]
MRTLIFLITLWLIPTYLFAQPSQVPVETYGKLPNKSMLVLSPNAERMAYRDTSNDKDLMVVIDLAKRSILAAIDVSTVKPTNVYFIDNDRLIFKTSDKKVTFIKLKHGDHHLSNAENRMKALKVMDKFIKQYI